MSAQGNLFTFLTLGQTLSRTFELFFDRLDIYMTIAAVVLVPTIILAVLLSVFLAHGAEPDMDHIVFIQEHMASVLLVMGLQLLLSTVACLAGEGGIVRATADIYCARQPNWYSSLKLGIMKFCPLLAAAIIVNGAWFITYLVTAIIASALLAFSETKLGGLFFLMALATVVFGAYGCVWIMITFIPVYQVIVIEEKGPISALRRSLELANGRRCYWFCGVFLLWIIKVVLAKALHAIFNGDDPAALFFSPGGVIVSFLPDLVHIPLSNM